MYGLSCQLPEGRDHVLYFQWVPQNAYWGNLYVMLSKQLPKNECTEKAAF